MKHFSLSSFIFYLSSFLFLGLGIWNLGLVSSKVDSLHTALATARHDTTRISTLNALGWELMYSNPDTAIILGNQALALAEALPSPSGIGSSDNIYLKRL